MLTDNELVNINGGKINWGVITLIGGIISLVSGILDGYFRPLKCN